MSDIYGGFANDTLQGSDGNDNMIDYGGDNYLSGAGGNDYLSVYSGTGHNALDGGEGEDLLYGGSGNDTLIGGSGYDQLYGYAGNNWLQGGSGNDQLSVYGDAGSNTLDGGDGDDTLYGGSGNETLDGGLGADSLVGGDGDDVYYVDDLNDKIDDTAGNDTVYVAVGGYKVSSSVENVVYSGGAEPLPYFINTLLTGYFWGGITQPQALTYSFATTAAGGETGFAEYTATQQNSVRSALSKYSAVAGLQFSEVSDGSGVQLRFFRDDLVSTGNSEFAGYAYYPTNGDVHIRSDYTDMAPGVYGFQLLLHEIGHALGLKHPFEAPVLDAAEDAQTNTVMTYNNVSPFVQNIGTFDLAAVQYLYGVNTGARTEDNTYTLSDRYIWDGAGNDTLSAAEQTSAVNISLQAGSWVYVGSKASSLLANGQAFIGYGTVLENLAGGAGNDSLTGNAADNRIDGGAGADTLAGGDGNDAYGVDNVADVVSESNALSAGGGIDTVDSSVSYMLADNLENLVLTGEAGSGYGNALNNTLTGNAADNTLDGGIGTDTLQGGLGNDSYWVDGGGDSVLEAAGAGIDTVISSVSYTLTENVENLTLIGTTASSATGYALDNVLTGNAGDNVLDGGAGADTLQGGLGNDSYLVDDSGDVVLENAGEGIDTIISALAYTLADNFENLTLTGALPLTGIGNALDNALTGNGAANRLEAGLGSDTLDGGLGDDSLLGGLGDDTYLIDSLADSVQEETGAGSDTVQSTLSYALGDNLENLTLAGSALIDGSGNAYNNRLLGNAADNVLDGGLGADTLQGGAGNDSYRLDNAGDSVTESSGAGIDTVYSTVFHTLGDNLENLILTGAAPLTGSGNALPNFLLGNAGNNLLDGGLGADTLQGGAGDDSYVVDDAGDAVQENADAGVDLVQSTLSYTLTDHIESLVLLDTALNGAGNALGNRLTGNAADNALDGGLGADTLQGGAGNDGYHVDDAGDSVLENAGAGVDTVYSAVSYTLGANLENLNLLGTATLNGVGNALDNSLNGNAGDNTLDGGLGTDTLQGGAGNDGYLVDNPDDGVLENAAEGNDTVQSSVSYTLAANLENLSLLGTALNGGGNALDNNLLGNAAGNLLDGGQGNDTLQGGAGNDVYRVDSGGDSVMEDAAAGTDTVQSTVSFTLGAEQENLVLTGSAPNSGTGNGQANLLLGNAADNVLDGGGGADTLQGGLGNDTYTLDDAGDNMLESSGAGTDTVLSALSYTLGANLENLVLTGAQAIDATGNGLHNRLSGNAQNNALDGGKGVDTLSGGAGNDLYRVDNRADLLQETAGAGTDSVQSSVSYSLPDNVENLTLTGTAPLNAAGNALNNALIGNAGKNVLDGGAGVDKLQGGAGADVFVFGTTAGGADQVQGFQSGVDRMQYKDAAAGLGLGDGDHLIEHAQLVNSATAVFSSLAELVIVAPNITGAINAKSAAVIVGSAGAAYGEGDSRLFAVDNGVNSALYAFHSAGTDARIAPGELTLVATLLGADHTGLKDYAFA
ncbi:MAG: matrixin family metalloprotease [Methylococcaceae bacterium]|nr:MAG: matrixin family metalloprotease [Methylococcaceae bacterium]